MQTSPKWKSKQDPNREWVSERAEERTTERKSNWKLAQRENHEFQDHNS